MSTSKEANPKIISKENSSGFQSWDLPNVGDNEDNNGQGGLLTANELEDIHQQAYSEGYEEGKLRGIKDGFEQGEEEGKKQGHQRAFDSSLKEIQQQTFHLEQLFKAIEAPLSVSNEQVEHELMSLAFSIAKIIIQRELQTTPEIVISLVKKSLDLLPSASKNIKIYLNPLDVAMVKEAFSNNEEIHFEDYKILDSSNLKRGGCIIDTNISHIDASLDNRIKELAKNIIPNSPNLNNSDSNQTSEIITDSTDLTETAVNNLPNQEDQQIENEHQNQQAASDLQNNSEANDNLSSE